MKIRVTNEATEFAASLKPNPTGVVMYGRSKEEAVGALVMLWAAAPESKDATDAIDVRVEVDCA